MSQIEALAKIAGYTLVTGANQVSFDRPDLIGMYNEVVLIAKQAMESNPLAPSILRATLQAIQQSGSIIPENLARQLWPATFHSSSARPIGVARQLLSTLQRRGYVVEHEAHHDTHYRLTEYGTDVLEYLKS